MLRSQRIRRTLRKTALVLSVVLFINLFVCGCADSKDINEKLIVTAVAVDKKDGDIWFYIEVANIEASKKGENGGGGSGDKYIVIKSHGKTLPEARENLNQQLDKEVYLSGVRTLIVTEAFAKEHLIEYLNRVREEENYRKKVITVITKEDPEKLFETINEKNQSVGYTTDDMIKMLDELGESFSRMTSRIIENLSSKYTGILIPCIGLEHSETSIIGYSVVKGQNVTGFLPREESRGMILLKQDKPEFTFVIPYKDNRFTIEVILKKRKLTPSYKNKKIHFNLDFDFEAKLLYGDKKIPYDFDKKATAAVSQSLIKIIKEEITQAIAQAQKQFVCDYIQFDDKFRIKFPVEYSKMNWNEEFPKITSTVNVDLKIKEATMMDYTDYRTQ